MQATETMAQFGVKPLPYDYTDLAPAISEQTLKLHHDKHYAGYVANLNKLVGGTTLADKSLEDIIRNSTGATFNNAAQAWNHEFYFDQFSTDPKIIPNGDLAKAIDAKFGSLEGFKEAVAASAAQLFGSGWVWVVADESGALSILNESNAGNPLTSGLKPIMTIDVWEHAYYVDYQNRRADSVSSFWNILDWDVVGARY